MKTIIALLLLLLLQGCALLSAMGISTASDVLPSLKYCHKVDYQRRGVDMELKAECRIPAG